MPRSKKKPRLERGREDTDVGYVGSAVIGTDDRPTATADDLSADIAAMVFGYFGPTDIMCFRCVCTKWRDAAKKTIVPLTANLYIDRVHKYNAMRVMTTGLPNLQNLSILYLKDGGHRFNNGQNPNHHWALATAGRISLDIEIISRFRQLRCLNLFSAGINGRYPFLFDFPLLQNLSICLCEELEFDLEMLAGLPLLQQIEFTYLLELTGNVNSLRVLKDTLQIVKFDSCQKVEGNFMELADFPVLRVLELCDAAVTGDLRDIGGNDFPKLEQLILPLGVVGGRDHEFQLISDVPEVMQAVHRLKNRRLFFERRWCLSRESPDHYDEHIDGSLRLRPPFNIEIVEAGTRHGWRWWGQSQTGTISHSFQCRSSCEMNWLDQEPDKESSDYETYEQEFQKLEQDINFYRGYLQPPSEDEYNRICVVGT